VSTAVLESGTVGRLFSEDEARAEADEGCVTLQERLDTAWRSLQAAGVAECPLCRDRVSLHDGAHGGCEGCGSRLG
jgi:hypothetical protein